MIPTGIQVFIATEAVDMRCGFDRLAGLALERVGYDARCGALFVFTSKRKSTLKILYFDGSGTCVFHKRLDRGVFAWPEAPADGARHIEVDDAMLETLLDGVAIEPRVPLTLKRVKPIH